MNKKRDELKRKNLDFLVNSCKQLNCSNKHSKIYDWVIGEAYRDKIIHYKNDGVELELIQKELQKYKK